MYIFCIYLDRPGSTPSHHLSSLSSLPGGLPSLWLITLCLLLQENPDLGALSEKELNLWEHFLLIGQFQARPYRFKCTMAVGNSFRVGYALARGPRCFDHLYYYQQHADLQSAGFSTASELFDHFVQFGQFEQRKIRFTCADTLSGLTEGFDSLQGDFRDESSESDDMSDDDVPSFADDSGYNDDPDMQQAVKSVLVTEVVKDLIKGNN
jgi:hypothetical protein